MAEISFEVINITVVPQDTGVSQYINVEAVINQPMYDLRYAKSTAEFFAGEDIGDL